MIAQRSCPVNADPLQETIFRKKIIFFVFPLDNFQKARYNNHRCG